MTTTYRGHLAREAHTARATPMPYRVTLSEVFFPHHHRYIGQSPRLRTHREIDWSRGRPGAGAADRPSAPRGVR